MVCGFAEMAHHSIARLPMIFPLGVFGDGITQHCQSSSCSAEPEFEAHPALTLPQLGTEQFDRIILCEGYCTLEVFCGCMAVTTSLMFSRVPTCFPWDCKSGEQFDVLKYGDQILATIALGILWFVMFGTHVRAFLLQDGQH